MGLLESDLFDKSKASEAECNSEMICTRNLAGVMLELFGNLFGYNSCPIALNVDVCCECMGHYCEGISSA
jgi:hypothetical protein